MAPPLKLATWGCGQFAVAYVCTISYATLALQGLLDLCCKTVADIIKGRVRTCIRCYV